MKNFKSISQIRSEFLEFFQEKGHTIIPSASLIPINDPSLLFINSGMAPFKDIFLEHKQQHSLRIANTQKCLRVSGKHNDLEEVGHDTYHHTFFEMLGNWSFGDYFKKEAIDMAWELLVERWKFPEDRLYVTVHIGDPKLKLSADEESAEFWRQYLPGSHILYDNTKNNFWIMGETGPCGQCSEIHIDLRSNKLRDQVPGYKCINQNLPTVIELWNLVFIQYNRESDHSLTPLSTHYVDTGMGLERLAAVMQRKTSTYDTDAFTQLFDQIAQLTPIDIINRYKTLNSNEDKLRVAMRVIVDHIRTIVIAISDGCIPSNTGQGYVIRRILRRAVKYGYTSLKIEKPFLYKLTPIVVETLGEIFPELHTKEKYIIDNIHNEEKAFLKTLKRGLDLFEQACNGINTITFENVISGEIAFLLHDTYGFPIDLTQLMAREHGKKVNMKEFNKLMQKQKNRARNSNIKKLSNQFTLEPTFDTNKVFISTSQFDFEKTFVGYDNTVIYDAKALYFDLNKKVIVLDKTPFYPERGGQIGDIGTLNFNDEIVQVINTKIIENKIIHFVDNLPDKNTIINAKIIAMINVNRRKCIEKHHTATHLLHAVLKEILSSDIEQKGSQITENYLRFDFNYHQQINSNDLRQIQERINEQIQKNIYVNIEENVPYQNAINQGATALFGEKYGDFVRTVTFDPSFSVELCGGTHVNATGEIGLFILQSEKSIATGIRRIHAVVGKEAIKYVTKDLDSLKKTKQLLKNSKYPIEKSVSKLLKLNQTLQKKVDQLCYQQLRSQLDEILTNEIIIENIHFIVGKIDDTNANTLHNLGKELQNRLNESSIGILGTQDPNGQKVYLIVVLTDDLIYKGFNAGKIVNQLAQKIDGRGGGRANIATAGGRSPEKLDNVLINAPKSIKLF